MLLPAPATLTPRQAHQWAHLQRKSMKLLKRELLFNKHARELGLEKRPDPARLPK